ncbi:translation initiation factor Sui1 [Desulfobotulus mexicanus]|uniref:Translation initiation factor Sui1 n=1 Tax=Desulfobotulus mexicanus TaxID=2586642 RepID=A0A5Q4VG33_9BACT|nr:translation initiation factor Sui1 [Desulfobotulus mexicanus]TYT75100.1 translation initiation factor Sui1 [Desulfobotulus mexicanus]
MKHSQNTNHGLVYSTELGRTCPACERSEKACICKNASISLPKDGVIRISRETKGRKGKGVTLVSGLPGEKIDDTAKELKQRCGCGGTVKDGRIEIQGDHRDTILSWLTQKGYKAKKAGG